MVIDLGGLEKTLSAKRGELAATSEQIETKQRTLEEMKVQEAGTKAHVAFLKESTAKDIKELADAAKGEVAKVCHELKQDVALWGNVRAELGECQSELKLARYFSTIPLSEQAVSNLVRDMDRGIIVQYLLLSRAWCKAKSNPKQKPPVAITKKYVGIANYTQV